ncbi:MAG: hypothetical protein JSU69_00240 [Candidatus Zixiibacteriota bacterium]|nr:MAG: hypothetical protein JSU69_00240 [candidate division Zixibacteria bacterium]
MKFFRLVCVLSCFMVIVGCGGERKTGNAPDKTVITTDEDAIRAVLIEYIERVMEGDKTVLYENEFMYYRDEVSLTEYMEYSWVKEYPYDYISGVEVDSVEVMGDSARAKIRVFYEATAFSGEEERPYDVTLYRSGEQWIRPYQSKWYREVEYMERIREYERAAEAETEEEGE